MAQKSQVKYLGFYIHDCRTKSIGPRQKVTGQNVSDIQQKVIHFFIKDFFVYIN